MPIEPTNAVLETMLKNVQTTISKMERHMEEQNGKVAKNTKYRYVTIGGGSVIAFIGLGNLIALLNLWSRI